MPEHFFQRPIPLWLTLVCLAVSMGAAFALASEYQTTVLDYKLSLISPDDAPIELRYGSWPSLASPDFFGKVKNTFISEKSSFIEADLTAMKLTVYQDGVPTLEVPIASKGKKSSWWETPSGLYSIQTKEENHFSSIGNVYMPWSMQFQGNFFVHGWPYYPDGTDVATTYSGGCIRLSTENAKKVYDATRRGMPILVFEEGFIPDSFAYELDLPDLSAASYLVADLKSNMVLARQAQSAYVPIGDIARLLNALVVSEYIDLDRELLTPALDTKDELGRIRAGRYYTVYELLHPLLLEGSRSAAEAFARYLGPQRFADLMMRNAQSFGMPSTHIQSAYENVDANRSTAEDLFSLAKHLYNTRRFILDMTADVRTALAYQSGSFDTLTSNQLLELPAMNFVGGMFGSQGGATDAKVGFAIAEIRVRDEVRPVAVIVLGSQDAKKDASELLQFAQRTYR